ncbi:nucleotidyl transferase AbiEii/AbiGii toxin family protein [Patescibacteria group bacterium]|nr:nucleotidyl transferase AbiEii/AbiGii toxin family protein [Patescibacteria group bacterium]
MILPRPQDALHKAQMYRLLINILDDNLLARTLYFKGGTCASLLGFLDRFSIDLDFDLSKNANKNEIEKNLHRLFKKLDYSIKDESQRVLQFFLKYPSKPQQRNTLKLDISDIPAKSNDYKPQYLKEIDRYAVCQTIETMFANKLVALKERYEKNNSIAGRDIYDIHHFFTQGLTYKPKIIEERRGIPCKKYLKELSDFVEEKITENVITQDLNFLLPYEEFNRIRKTLKQETLVLLRDEIKSAKPSPAKTPLDK